MNGLELLAIRNGQLPKAPIQDLLGFRLSAMGAAVHSTLAQGEAYTTLETKVNLVRAIRADTGELRAEGRVVHRGRTTATAEGRFVGAADGKLYAHGTSTCLILRS